MFSKTYLKQPATHQDSERLRNRLAARASEMLRHADTTGNFVRLVEEETGAQMPSVGGLAWDVGGFFQTAEMRDVLDAVTCAAAVLPQDAPRRRWIEFAQRSFVEEGMAFRIDDNGVAHYYVDPAFHEVAESVVASLTGRFAAAGASVDKAVSQLTKAEPDGKHAIRDVFEGVESAFKIVIGSGKDLTEANVAGALTPIVDRQYSRVDDIAKRAAARTVESFKDWVNACHNYRHGHGAPDPIEPPVPLAVALVGNGLNFARWLASLA